MMRYQVLNVGGIGVLQAAPGQFYWYPLEPRLALHDDNSPQISWLPEARRLILTTAWGGTPKQLRILAGIRDLLAELEPEIIFEPAPVSISAVTVSILSDDGESLATFEGDRPSNITPYNTSFEIDLDAPGEAGSRAVAMREGLPRTRIEYRGFLRVAVKQIARYEIFGDAKMAVANLNRNRPEAKGKRRSISSIDARKEVERALSVGELASRVSFTGGESSELKGMAEREAVRVTSEKLKDLADQTEDDAVLSPEDGCSASRENVVHEDVPLTVVSTIQTQSM
jgi:hypothetical protein